MITLEKYLINQYLITPEQQKKKIEEIVSQILPSERANYPEDDRKAAELFLPQYARMHKAKTARIVKVFVSSPPLAVILEESGIEKPYKGKLKAPLTIYQDENQVIAEFKNNYNKLRDIFKNGNDKTDEDYIGVPSTSVTPVGVAVRYSELNGEEVTKNFTMKELVNFCQLELLGEISNDISTSRGKDEAEKYPITCKVKQLQENKIIGKNKKGLRVAPVSSPSFKGLNQFINSYYVKHKNLNINGVKPLSPKNKTELIEIKKINKANTRSVRLKPLDETLKYKKIKIDNKVQTVRPSVIVEGVPTLVMKQEFTNSIFARNKEWLDPLELANKPEILADRIARDITSIISNKDDATLYGYADLIDEMKKFLASQPPEELDMD